MEAALLMTMARDENDDGQSQSGIPGMEPFASMCSRRMILVLSPSRRNANTPVWNVVLTSENRSEDDTNLSYQAYLTTCDLSYGWLSWTVLVEMNHTPLSTLKRRSR